MAIKITFDKKTKSISCIEILRKDVLKNILSDNKD
jgi:hypothetical protein